MAESIPDHRNFLLRTKLMFRQRDCVEALEGVENPKKYIALLKIESELSTALTDAVKPLCEFAADSENDPMNYPLSAKPYAQTLWNKINKTIGQVNLAVALAKKAKEDIS